MAQAFSYGMTPVISRLFSPADFGLFGSFYVIVTVIGAGITLQYSQALMMPKEDGEAANVMALSFLSVAGIVILCTLVLVLFSGPFLRLFRAADMGMLIWLLPLAILINGFNQTSQAWCVRRKAFRRTALSQVVRSVTASTGQIILGFAGMGSAGLVGGAVIGDGAANTNLIQPIFVNDRKLIRSALNWSSIRKLAREYHDFPLYLTPQSVLNAASQGLPVVLLANSFGLTVAGYYAFGVRMVQAPMYLVLGPLRQVLFQKASETHNQGKLLYPLFIKTTGGLIAVSVLPALVGFIWGPSLSAWVFGQRWLLAGEYARWLILWLFPAFCNVPSVLMAQILRRQRNVLAIEIVTLVLRAATLIIGGLLLSALGTVILFSVAGAVINLYLITWIWRLVLAEDRKAASG
jgi:O-antigen/teichoic acid export membrane protein